MMLKLALTSLVLALNLSVVSAQQSRNDRPPFAFGPVKTIREETYVLERKNGKWVAGERSRLTETTFNRDKTRIEVMNHDICRKEVYTLSPLGKLTNYDLFERDGSHSGTKAVYSFGPDGRTAEAVHFLLGQLNYRESYAYSADGLRVEIRRQFESDESPSLEVNRYDLKGNIVESSGYSPDGRLLSREVYKYDDKGNPIEVISSGDLVLPGKDIFKYKFDARGNWIEMEWRSWIVEDESRREEAPAIIKRSISYY